MDIRFEDYEYKNSSWVKEEKVTFNEQQLEVRVDIEDYKDNDKLIPESGKETLKDFLEHLDQNTAKIAEAVFQYYVTTRKELGYTEEENPLYPAINEAKDILEKITLTEIIIPYTEDHYNKTTASLLFDCSWDLENGIAVCFEDEEITEVGYQDIAL